MQGQWSLLLGPARLCLRLLLLLGYRRRCPPLLRGLVQRWRYGKVCLRSLLYNSFGGSDTAVDAAFEPIYWLVDNVIRWCGVVSDAQGQEKGCLGSACVWRTYPGSGPTLASYPWEAPESALGIAELSHGIFLTSPVLAGVRGAGDCADQLHRGHRLPVCPAPHPPNLLRAPALLAFLL